MITSKSKKSHTEQMRKREALPKDASKHKIGPLDISSFKSETSPGEIAASSRPRGGKASDGSLANSLRGYSLALQRMGPNRLTGAVDSFRQSMAERYRKLDDFGLMRSSYLSMYLDRFLETPQAYLKCFENEKFLFPFIQPVPYNSKLPDFGMMKVEVVKLSDLAREVARIYDPSRFMIAAVPFRKIIYNANIRVLFDGSAHGEFTEGKELPSDPNVRIGFSFSLEAPCGDTAKPRLTSSSSRPEHLKAIDMALRAITTATRRARGYYEVALTSNAEALVVDFREQSSFVGDFEDNELDFSRLKVEADFYKARSWVPSADVLDRWLEDLSRQAG